VFSLIRRQLLVFSFALFALAPVQAADEARTVLVVGDSLSAAYGIDQNDGWVALLRDRLKKESASYDVVNASISGDTTAGGVNRLESALRKHTPAVVVLELGANDGLRGLPVKDMRANLQRMIEMSLAAGARVLLVGMRIPTNYGIGYTQKFAEAYQDLASQFKLPLVPFLLDGVALDMKLMQDDGLHPRAEAQPTLLENVWPHLKPLLSAP
jgi:acyl-CoA thioesterase-1